MSIQHDLIDVAVARYGKDALRRIARVLARRPDLRARLDGFPVSLSQEEPEDPYRALAMFYADIWNLGIVPDENEIETVGGELADGEWVLFHDGDSWKVKHGTQGTVELGQARAPRGGVQIGPKWYPGGRWIPSQELDKADPETRARIEGEAKAHHDKRRSRGDVDTGKLRKRLEPHKQELSPKEQRNLRLSYAGLKRHHGELVVHRLEEVADQLEKAYEKATDPAQKEEIGKRLRGVNDMLDMAEKDGHKGEVAPQEAKGEQKATEVKEAPAAQESPKEESQSHVGKEWDGQFGRRRVIGEMTVGGEKRLVIQTGDQKSGHTLLKPEELESEIRLDTYRSEGQKLHEEMKAKEEAAAAAKKNERQNLQGFTDGLTPVQKGRIEAALDHQVRADGRYVTRRQLVEEKVGGGYQVKNAPDGTRRLMAENGVYLDEKQIGKAAMDYADHLQKKKATPAAPEQAKEAPKADEAKPSLASLPDKELAEKVLAAADAQEYGFGNNKVYISDVYDTLKKEDPSLTLEDFKKRLVDLSQAGLISWGRADLPIYHRKEDLDRSELKYLTGTFHYIHPREERWRKSRKDEKPEATQPVSVDKNSREYRVQNGLAGQHELTQEEYLARAAGGKGNLEYLSQRQKEAFLGEHRKKIKEAMDAGESVPPEVLKDYPDLSGEKAPEKKKPSVKEMADTEQATVQQKAEGPKEKQPPVDWTRIDALRKGKWAPEETPDDEPPEKPKPAAPVEAHTVPFQEWEKNLHESGDWKKYSKRKLPLGAVGLRIAHREEVASALKKGKDVPVEVLRAYPDLVKKYRDKLEAKGVSLAMEEPEETALDLIVERAAGAGFVVADAVKEEIRAAAKKAKTAEEFLEAVKDILSTYQPYMVQILSDSMLAARLTAASAIVERITPEVPPITPEGPPPERFELPEPEDEPVIRYPIIEEAAQSMSRRKVLTQDEYRALDGQAKSQAFNVAGVQSESALTAIRDELAESAEQGKTFKEFVERADEVTDGLLGPFQLETVFRTNIAQQFKEGQKAVLENEYVKSGFPFLMKEGIDDGRQRPHHLWFQKNGLDETNVFWADDPVIRQKGWYFPVEFNCRCLMIPLSVEDAAARGVKAAQEWLATGVMPEKQYVAPPDFELDPHWR